MLPSKLAFVDIETTGTRSSFDRIIEVGIVRVEDNKIVKTYQSLINPQTHVPPEIEILTGIKVGDLESAPTFREVADEILEVLKDAFFVAHNVRFDYSFLKYEFKRREIFFSPKHFCTVRLSRALFPSAKHHNLDSLIERFQIKCEKRHRALSDAHVLFEFYQKIQSILPLEKILDAINIGLRRPAIPLALALSDLQSLPELPGVYIFYGQEDAPLYIGKSINLRHRVLSHFSGDVHSPLEMKISQQIKRIETIPTAGELGALLLESDLIKRLMPLYNRKLRTKKQLVAIKSKKNTAGFATAFHNLVSDEEIAQLHTVVSAESELMDTFLEDAVRHPEQHEGSLDSSPSVQNDKASIVGFFRSNRQAKDYLYRMAKEHNLCEKLLGLESAGWRNKGPCFGYRLGRCKGACIGEEKQLFYNLRFADAFSHTRIASWPFSGPILIEENDHLNNKTDHLIVDKWCFLGNIVSDENGNLNEIRRDYTFDLDMYKILRQYLRSAKNVRRIKLFRGDIAQTF
ncbi:MAG: 3'-5' exoribonuclease [Candidatus Levybacteria bacterium]|nr:3'-5' exoribonuclease [Candidatus Levybacteria bacterium]